MSIFGASYNYKILPGVQAELDKYKGEDLTSNFKFGKSRAQKSSDKIIRRMDDGTDISQYMASDLAGINAGAARNADLIRKRMSGALAFQPPAVKAGATEDALANAELNRQEAVANSQRGLRETVYSGSQRGRDSQNAAAEAAARIRQQQLEQAIALRTAAFKPATGGSFLGGLLKKGIGTAARIGAAAATGGGSEAAIAAKGAFSNW